MFLKNLNSLWHSLRTRILISILIMLLPIIVLMYSAYNSIKGNTRSLTQIIDAPINELTATNKIQSEILKSELPFHLFLNRGESADRDSFVRLASNIELMFENILKLESMSSPDGELLASAQNEWQQAREIGEKLLSLNNIPPMSELVSNVDIYGRHLGRAVSLLDEVSENALDEIKNHRFIAQDNEWQSIGTLTLIFALGLLLAALAALSLRQSVIQPIRRMEKSVIKFGQGNLAERINFNSNDELGHLASAFNTLAERYEHIQNELNFLSVHDNLTGLYDRTKLQEEVALEIQRAKRYDRAFSLLLIDIDNFAEVNEKYGRLVGDSVLCAVANTICSTVRPTDLSSRFGGNEFGVILSETDNRGAQETAARLEQAIQENPINIGDGKSLSIDINIGLSTYPNEAETEAGLFAKTEQSLSQAKLKSNNKALNS